MTDFYSAELLTIGREKTSLMLQLFAVMERDFGNGIGGAHINNTRSTHK